MAGASFSKATIQILLNAQNALKDLKSFQNNFTSGMGTMKTALAGFVGYKGLQGAYDSVKQLTDLSDKWRVPVEKMSRFRNLLIAMGGDANEALSTFEKLKQGAQQWRFHSNGQLKDLSAILWDNLYKKDPVAVLDALRAQWPRLEEDAQEEVLRLLGTDSVGIRNMLRANESDYANALDRASRMPTVSEEEAQATRDIKKSAENINNNLEKLLSLVNQFVTSPVLKVVSGASNALANPTKAETKDYVSLGGAALAGGALLKGGSAVATKIGTALASKSAIAGAAATGAGAAGGVAGSVLSGAGALLLMAVGEHELVQWMQRHEARTAADRINSGVLDDDPQTLGYNAAWIEQALADQGKRFEQGEREFLATQAEVANKRVAELAKASAREKFLFNMLTNPETRKYYSGISGNTPSVNQTINIYGIKGAEDIAPALRSVVMQNMSPTQGY